MNDKLSYEQTQQLKEKLRKRLGEYAQQKQQAEQPNQPNQPKQQSQKGQQKQQKHLKQLKQLDQQSRQRPAEAEIKQPKVQPERQKQANEKANTAGRFDFDKDSLKAGFIMAEILARPVSLRNRGGRRALGAKYKNR